MDGKNGAGRQRLSRCQEAFARGLAQGRGLCGAYRAAYRCGGLEDGPVEARARLLLATEKVRARCAALRAAAAKGAPRPGQGGGAGETAPPAACESEPSRAAAPGRPESGGWKVRLPARDENGPLWTAAPGQTGTEEWKAVFPARNEDGPLWTAPLRRAETSGWKVRLPTENEDGLLRAVAPGQVGAEGWKVRFPAEDENGPLWTAALVRAEGGGWKVSVPAQDEDGLPRAARPGRGGDRPGDAALLSGRKSVSPQAARSPRGKKDVSAPRPGAVAPAAKASAATKSTSAPTKGVSQASAVDFPGAEGEGALRSSASGSTEENASQASAVDFPGTDGEGALRASASGSAEENASQASAVDFPGTEGAATPRASASGSAKENAPGCGQSSDGFRAAAPEAIKSVPGPSEAAEPDPCGRAAGAARVLEELTDIALGRRDYPDVDRAGNPVVRPVPMTQRLKALELLGKRYRLFSDGPAAPEEEELEVRLRVIR